MNLFSVKLTNKQQFSKIDLISDYHQIKMYRDNISKTAIITPFGFYKYNYLPFELKNAI